LGYIFTLYKKRGEKHKKDSEKGYYFLKNGNGLAEKN